MLPEEKEMLTSIVQKITSHERVTIPDEEKEMLKSILEKVLASKNEDMPVKGIERELKARLESLPSKRYKSHEQFKMISEFLLAPLLPELIEINNVMHRVHVTYIF